MNKKLTQIGIGIYFISLVTYVIEFLAELTDFAVFYIPWKYHEVIELIVLIGLVAGFWLLLSAYRSGYLRQEKMETQLKKAKGEFQEAMRILFERWGLSDAEKDVALLTIKGLTISQIAQLRDTSEGTVKTQSSAIYKKAGVSSRSQLVSDVIEELLE